jgi:hypothetical protein
MGECAIITLQYESGGFHGCDIFHRAGTGDIDVLFPAADNRGVVSSSEFDSAPAVLVVFICPAAHLCSTSGELARFGGDFQVGLAIAAINSSDTVTYRRTESPG